MEIAPPVHSKSGPPVQVRSIVTVPPPARYEPSALIDVLVRVLFELLMAEPEKLDKNTPPTIIDPVDVLDKVTESGLVPSNDQAAEVSGAPVAQAEMACTTATPVQTPERSMTRLCVPVAGESSVKISVRVRLASSSTNLEVSAEPFHETPVTARSVNALV